PRISMMSDVMLSFAEPVKEVSIVDEQGNPILGGNHDRLFFESACMHKYNGTYYLLYSIDDTHFIVYASVDNPYCTFTYRGVILNPVIGCTNHHSIVEFNGKWYLFYHDSSLSGGKTHLRCIKVTELTHNADGTIETISPYIE